MCQTETQNRRGKRSKNTIVYFLGILGWSRNPFAQFLHTWPLLWQIALSHGSSASSCTMCGHPSESKAKVAGVYLLNSLVVYLTISSPIIPGIQLGRTLGPAYPGSDGLQEAALCKMVSGKGLSSAEAHLEPGWYRPSVCSWRPALSWHIPTTSECAIRCCCLAIQSSNQ